MERGWIRTRDVIILGLTFVFGYFVGATSSAAYCARVAAKTLNILGVDSGNIQTVMRALGL